MHADTGLNEFCCMLGLFFTAVEGKVFNDCIHGHITLPPECVSIIDTPEFQRMRNIKQTGSVYFVYPGASHNRFEHSLGVCYLAGQMVDALNYPKDRITASQKMCLQIAGLCHDLGHGPFSHTWEKFLRRSNIDWMHEEASVEMFKYLLENNPEVNKLFSEQEKTLINELIIGTGGSLNDEEKYLYEVSVFTGTECCVPNSYIFKMRNITLFDNVPSVDVMLVSVPSLHGNWIAIISNEENGIDVDKWDYLLRDGMQLNLKITFDYRRLLQFCRILRVSGRNHVCFQRKTEIDVCNMFQMRALLHHLAYQHSVSKNIELMFVDALIAADNAGFTVNTKTKQYKLSEAHTSMEAFSHLTDHIFYDILYSPLEELSEAQKIIKRILTRDLYKLVGSRYQDVTSTKVNEIVKCLKDELDQKLANAVDNDEDRLKNFAIEIKKLDKGCKMFANPFANIFFFDKNTPDVAVSINPQNVPIFGCNEDYTLCRIEALVFCKTKIDNDDCTKLKLALNLD